MRGLSPSSLASAGAVGAAGAWSLSIKVLMNSWKRSLFGGATGAGAGTGPGAISGPGAGLRAGRLVAGLPRQTGGIVTVEGAEAKQRGILLPSKRAG